ncbi:MAG: hypothetical protein EOO07_32685 [Chitinophagaceae bacterium]|nr:MAG: hypothetical protein EOO07_32685 [Chitinophagaceae bacterium]
MKNLTLLLVLFLLGSAQANAQAYTTNAEATLDLSSVTDGNSLLNVRYFYYPNLQAYFDRETSTYLYSRNGKDWIESSNLPAGLRGYSMSNGKRVPLTNYAGDEPYELIAEHQKQFPANYSTKRQLEDKAKDENIALN